MPIWSACLSAWPIFTSPSAPPWGNGSWVPPGSGGSCLSSSSSWAAARTGTSATASTARNARRVGLIDRRGGPRYGPPHPPSLGRAPAQPWRASALTQDVSSIVVGGPDMAPQPLQAKGAMPPLGLPRLSLGRAPAQPWRASGLTRDVSSRSAVGQRVELPGERRALGDRQLARVIPADVGRRLAVDGRTALEQRHAGRSLATAAHHPRRDEVRHEASEHLLRERRGLLELRRRHQRDLDARAEMEIERAEEAAEGRRVTSHQISHRAQRGERVTLVALVAGERGETQQHLDGDRRAAGHRIVVEVARPDDQALVVGARVEQPADSPIPEEPQDFVRE